MTRSCVLRVEELYGISTKLTSELPLFEDDIVFCEIKCRV